TVFHDPIHFNVKHPLQRRWTLFFDNPQEKSGMHNWEMNVKSIVTFDTVEDFWGVYNNVLNASQLGAGCNYHLFKEGVRPAWEDPANVNGGKWVTVLPKTRRAELDRMWMETILGVVGETFPKSDEICGVVMSIRIKQDRLSLWTKTALDAEATKAAGQHWKKILNFEEMERIGYQAHSDALRQDSSYFNDDMYSV
ncbi:translation initiation factor eIF 4e-like domain-containing protein, partial [Powellomyces hirtus]